MKKLLFLLTIFLTTNLKSQNLKTLEEFVKDWIGTPYRFGGESKKTGIDCSAFAQRLYKDVYGLDIPRTCYYQYNELKKTYKKDLKEGDLIFFNSKVSPSGWHVGVYIGAGEFIHASNYRDGVKISCLYNDMYERIYKGATTK